MLDALGHALRPDRPKPKPGAQTAHEVRLVLKEVEDEAADPDAEGKRPKVQKVDDAAMVDSADAVVEAFLQERRDAELPLPEKQDILDRIAQLARNVNPVTEGGTNSAAENQRFYLVHQDTPPYFGVGTGK